MSGKYLHNTYEGITLYTTIRKGQRMLCDHMMRRESSETIVTAGNIIGRRDRDRSREIILDSLKWRHEGIS